MNFVSLILAVGTLTFLTVWLLVRKLMQLQANQQKKERIKARVGLVSNFVHEPSSKSKCWLCVLGRAIGPKSEKELLTTQQQLGSAGYHHENAIGAYFLIKYGTVILALVFALALWTLNFSEPALLILLPIVSLLLPERVLLYLAKRRLSKISQNLPDFLDMCNICMNAGLSYLVAVKRVATELKDVHPEICFEFEHLLEQIQIGVNRMDALRRFAERNPTREIENLAQVLIQNEKLGSSITEALNEFSRRMYQDREQLLEEKAAKTSAKMALVIMPFMLAPYLILLLGERMVLLSRGL